MLIAYGYCKMRTKIPKVARSPSVIFFPRIQAAAQTCSKGKRLFFLYLQMQDETCPCLLLADRSANTISISRIWARLTFSCSHF